MFDDDTVGENRFLRFTRRCCRCVPGQRCAGNNHTKPMKIHEDVPADTARCAAGYAGSRLRSSLPSW